MSTSASEPTAMEDEKGSLLNGSHASSSILSYSSLNPPSTTAGPTFSHDTTNDNKVASMASDVCSPALSSPAEASPAKPSAASTSPFEENFKKSQATSHMTSASDSQPCPASSLIDIKETPTSFHSMSTFGNLDDECDFPSVLTFKGVTVSLENNNVWKQFHSCGTEMILTKQGRRMFPYCRYRLSGLDPERNYSLVLSVVPSSQFRYRWNTLRWEIMGPAEHQAQSLIRAYPHHYSPCRGADWMNCLVSFYKLKLTNFIQDQDGHIILHSMHRYIPRLHIIPVPDGADLSANQTVVMGPDCITFTFPQTEFMAVTTYQNFRITQLKINHNPFAKGFREDGNNPRLNRTNSDGRGAMKTESQPVTLIMAEPILQNEEVLDLSMKAPIEPEPASVQEPRPVLKPIMSNPAGTGEQYVPCLRGKHSLGELVLVQKPQCPEPSEEDAACVTPEKQSGSNIWKSPKGSLSSPSSSPPLARFRKRRKRIIKRWGNPHGRLWKTAAAAPSPPVLSPSLSTAMQPELDEIEGLVFVSFTSKEALDLHVGVKSPLTTAPESPSGQTTPTQMEEIMEESPETVDEEIARLELNLLNDLKDLKQRQVIHPVLQQVGLKISTLDPSLTIDLQYLGVCVPLAPLNFPETSMTTTTTMTTALSPETDEGIPFISRTGKTTDMTKIKGWKNKFLRSNEASPNSEGIQKNLSAFCSNMLDEYLENEAQQVSDRADTFSMNAEDSVSYQLPDRSSSYVKTLDSVLKHRNGASNNSAKTNKPCPLSHKPPSYLAAMSTPPSHTPADTSESYEVPQSLPDSSRVSTTHKLDSASKTQQILSRMEKSALNEGLSRTKLTPERLALAFSALVTKELASDKVTESDCFPTITVVGPKCGKDFCRLGCVCLGLQNKRKVAHCKRPECIFGCLCPEDAVEVHPDAWTKLWRHKTPDRDQDSLFVPKTFSNSEPLAPLKVIRQITALPIPLIREEDKDPVYKYLESKLTCARVREYNCSPPPKLTLDFKNQDFTVILDNNSNPQKSAQNNPPNPLKRTVSNTPTAQKAEEKPPQASTLLELEAKKQIQIQSLCAWKEDYDMILKALCVRMKQNHLCRRFHVGPYTIVPLAKIVLQKPSGSTITYRIQITERSKVGDNNEEVSDFSDIEQQSDGMSEESSGEEVEDEPLGEHGNYFGVTPFLTGVTPSGRLKARTKPAGCQESGLIQVNGKSYNQAKLMLGQMGSLHPANRLAAYVTGRLQRQDSKNKQTSVQPESTVKSSSSTSLRLRVGGTPVPQVVPKSNTTESKTTQASAPLSQPESLGKESPQTASAPKPAQSFHPVQNSSTSSPVSLTVSPSLKSPSFLAQSGTYSFRICPPSNGATADQKLPGVVLPGGFTLIQLPKPGADGQLQKPQPLPSADAPEQKAKAPTVSHVKSGWLSLNTLDKLKTLMGDKSAPPKPASEPVSVEKQPSEEKDKNVIDRTESNTDANSEDCSSDFSDDGDFDDNEEVIDIETVENEHEEVLANMKAAARKTMLKSWSDVEDFSEEQAETEPNVRKTGKVRENHCALEKIRRNEQRARFDRLQRILNADPKAPRLHLLSLATKEIEGLIKMTIHLEEEKEKLNQRQSQYVRKLSFLSGKSEMLIRNKMEDISERQKRREESMKSKGAVSPVPETKAPSQQVTGSLLCLQAPKPQPDGKCPSQPAQPSQNNLPRIVTLVQPQNLEKLLASQKRKPDASLTQPLGAGTSTSHILVQRCDPKGLIQVGRLASKLEQNQEAAGDAGNETGSDPQAKSKNPSLLSNAELQAILTQSEALSSDSGSSQASQSVASLPLIRSKTGRIILPSSLKPLGQGIYTLMVVKSKGNKEKENPSKTLPSVQDSPTSSERVFLASDPSLHSEPGQTRKTSTVAGSESKSFRAAAPLTHLTILKSIARPSVTANEKQTTSSMSSAPRKEPQRFNLLNLTSVSTSHVAPRPSNKIKKPVVEKRPKGLVYLLDEHLNENLPDKPEEKGKRRRGRPPKQKPPQLNGPQGKRGIKSTSPSDKDASVRYSASSLKLADSSNSAGGARTTRPLTRGSLGKDFPSAKKRNWIDVEKELDPDLESESE